VKESSGTGDSKSEESIGPLVRATVR
jgi:hypothetical protein